MLIKKKKILFAIALLYIQISLCFALDINITGTIINNPLNYIETIIINLDCNEDLQIDLPKESQNVVFENNKIENKTLIIDNCLHDNIIEYRLNKIEKLDTNIYRLERKFNNLNNINYSFKLIIPIDYSIDRENTFPQNYIENSFDIYREVIFDKNDIYLIYIKKNELENQEITFSNFYTEIKEGNTIFLLILSFSLGILVTYFYFNKTNKKRYEQIVPSYVLSSEEKKVLDVIKRNPGMNQKQIGIELDYSKPRISAIVNNLEQKQLIKREKFGRSFKVFINKKIV